jgi:hypothetical protein
VLQYVRVWLDDAWYVPERQVVHTLSVVAVTERVWYCPALHFLAVRHDDWW